MDDAWDGWNCGYWSDVRRFGSELVTGLDVMMLFWALMVERKLIKLITEYGRKLCLNAYC